MAMAAPERIERVPISELLNPGLFSPIASTAALKTATTISFGVMCWILPFLQTAETGVSSFVPGVTSDSFYYCISDLDGAHEGVICAFSRHSVVPFIFLLEFKGN